MFRELIEGLKLLGVIVLVVTQLIIVAALVIFLRGTADEKVYVDLDHKPISLECIKPEWNGCKSPSR